MRPSTSCSGISNKVAFGCEQSFIMLASSCSKVGSASGNSSVKRILIPISLRVGSLLLKKPPDSRVSPWKEVIGLGKLREHVIGMWSLPFKCLSVWKLEGRQVVDPALNKKVSMRDPSPLSLWLCEANQVNSGLVLPTSTRELVVIREVCSWRSHGYIWGKECANGLEPR